MSSVADGHQTSIEHSLRNTSIDPPPGSESRGNLIDKCHMVKVTKNEQQY